MRSRPAVALLATLLVAVLAWPLSASAHGIAGPPGVPVPGYLFAWAAALVLGLSFLALSRLWNTPRLERAPGRRIGSLPVAVEVLCGALGVALFAALVYCGLAGMGDPDANLLPPFVYVVFWVTIVPLSLLLGDVFALFNPWRAVGRAVGWALRARRRREPRPYPARLGRWPAVLTILCFAWLELVYERHDVPSLLAVLALAYAAVQLGGMARFGVDAWTARGDGFAVYFNLFGRLAVLRRHGRVLERRPLLSGATALTCVPGTVPLLCVMLGSTGFDGLSGTGEWRDLAGRSPSAVAGTLGLLVMIAIVAAVFTLGVRGMGAGGSRRVFIHTLIPIAAAYVIAHYLTFLLVQLQAVVVLASDPLGHGANLFGTAGWTVDFHPLPRGVIWGIQVGALVAGHVAGLVLAHDRALVRFRDPRQATDSQRWMLVVMVFYTGLGLWLLASSTR